MGDEYVAKVIAELSQMTTSKERALALLHKCDIDLPKDALTMEKIRERAFAFQFESSESLSFRIERHPTMYLSDMGVPGLDASPARFHVLTEYRLDLSDETWRIEDLDATFEYEPWMVVEAELGDYGMGEILREEIRQVKNADDPKTAFEESFASLIDHWENKFDKLDGRKVPEGDKEAIIELLVDTLKERADIE